MNWRKSLPFKQETSTFPAKMVSEQISQSGTLYFISDLHFHINRTAQDDEKIRRLRQLFKKVREERATLYIVGDLFDFWFEYKYVVPRQHFDLLRLLGDLVEDGIEVHYLAGNHDYWIDTFLEEQIGMIIHPEPIELLHNDTRFWICHGDGILPDDKGYRLMKKVLRHPLSITLFRLIHPDLGFKIAELVSSTSRKYNSYDVERNRKLLEEVYHEYIQPIFREGYDYAILGHLHRPHIHTENGQTFVNLGDWLHFYSFARFDGSTLHLNYWTA